MTLLFIISFLIGFRGEDRFIPITQATCTRKFNVILNKVTAIRDTTLVTVDCRFVDQSGNAVKGIIVLFANPSGLEKPFLPIDTLKTDQSGRVTFNFFGNGFGLKISDERPGCVYCPFFAAGSGELREMIIQVLPET